MNDDQLMDLRDELLDLNDDGQANILDLIKVINLVKLYGPGVTLNETIYLMLRDLYPEYPGKETK